MTWQKSLPISAIILGIFFTLSFSEPAMAASGQTAGGVWMAAFRVIIIALSIGLGLVFGLLLSPNGQDARKTMFLLLCVIGGLLVLFVDGGGGGTITWIFAGISFVGAALYNLSSGLKMLGETPTTFGSSRWANKEDLQENNIFGTNGIRLGEVSNGESMEAISYKGERHLLTVAPTRSGKGTTQIIPNLLTYEGSMLVIDPKGENALITAKRRQEMGQEVHIVDPWGIANVEGIEPASFNPLDWLDLHDSDMTENAMLLASAIVVEGNSKDPFWDEEAKALLQGLIMFVATDLDEDGERHLGRVRELLLLNNMELDQLFERMTCSVHPIVRSTGERSLQKEEKMRSSVLSTAQSHTHFLDSDRMNANMKSSHFKFEDLKTKKMTIYLVLPADRLNTFGRWLRLLVQQAITINARNIETKPEKSILFLLDEFASLGRLTMVEQAFGLMAGYGMQIWAIIQDLNQLERIYGKGWQSFISNAGMINYFGSSDKMTADYFSSLCGETTVWDFSTAVSFALGSSSGGSSDTKTTSDTRSAKQRKLIYPDELMRLPAETQIVFLENMYPLHARKMPWFFNPELKDLGRNLQD